jgi:hypothetical protein
MTERELKEAEARAAELETIRLKAGGTLKPEDVVSFARSEKTALHSAFTWDDGDAATQYRLWQARQVIRVCVTYSEQLGEPIRTYVSLREDRGEDGYRLLGDVLGDAVKCQTLLEQALQELAVWQDKYRQLTELAPVIKAADKVRERGKQKQQPIRVTTKTSDARNGKRKRALAVSA